jgi:hypothetical protein
MQTTYVTLSNLSKQTVIYEHLPLPIQAALRHSILLSILSSIVFLPLAVFAPQFLVPVTGGFFGLLVPVANWLIGAVYTLQPILIVLSLASLLLSLCVVVNSLFLTRPVSEPFHWIGSLAAVPAGINTITVTGVIALFALLVVVTIIGWVLWGILLVIFAILQALYQLFIGIVAVLVLLSCLGSK